MELVVPRWHNMSFLIFVSHFAPHFLVVNVKCGSMWQQPYKSAEYSEVQMQCTPQRGCEEAG